MKLKVYYGGHSISDNGILKLKLKTDFSQQTEAGALYATVLADAYTVYTEAPYMGKYTGRYVIDSVKIDNKRDTTIVLKGYYESETFITLYEILKKTSEEDMQEITFQCESAGCM